MTEPTETFLTGDFGELRVERGVVCFNSEPDTEWTYTDRQGHTHRYDSGEGGPYPTLKPFNYLAAEDGREIEVFSHLECRECGEEIVPGFEWVQEPLRTVAYLNGDEVPMERVQEIMDAFDADMRRAAKKKETGS